jgi:hypothetical protein
MPELLGLVTHLQVDMQRRLKRDQNVAGNAKLERLDCHVRRRDASVLHLGREIDRVLTV